jgi:hypothetical protein
VRCQTAAQAAYRLQLTPFDLFHNYAYRIDHLYKKGVKD